MRYLSFFFVFGLLGFSACMTTTKLPELPAFTLEEITLVAEPDANMGDSLEVEIVFAQDVATLKHIEGFTALGWASVQDTELGTWEGKIASLSHTISPGRSVTLTEFPEGYREAVGIVIFAHYDSPGLHRRVVVGEPEVSIYLHSSHMSTSVGKPFNLTSPPEPANPQGSRL